MEKVWIILRSRIDLEGDTALIETEDEVSLDPSGEPFFGSWTDNVDEFEKDDSIQLLVRAVEDLLDDMDTAIAKIQALNSDNITEDDGFEELREYLTEHGLSEEEAERVIEGLQGLGVDELYTSPYFNFYTEYDIEPTTDAYKLLKELVVGYENWADVEEEAAWYGIETNGEAEWFYDFVQDFYEKTDEEVLFEASYLDARLNKHYHTVKYEEWGDKYGFIIYEKSGVGYGRKIRICNAFCEEEVLNSDKLKELQEKADNAEDTDELIDIIEEALDVAGFEGGRITWAETW